MLYAKFMYPDNGFYCDSQKAKDANLKIGKKYEVKELIMGQSNTSIFLKNIDGHFNSVQFDFEEDDGVPVNIYKDPKYNPYL